MALKVIFSKCAVSYLWRLQLYLPREGKGKWRIALFFTVLIEVQVRVPVPVFLLQLRT
jgi:hypothetical protein